MSPEPTDREVVAALTTLSTLVKSKGKRQRETPLYFKTRGRTRIKQGIPQTPTKAPIIIEDSPKEQENLVSPETKGEEGTSKKASPKSPIPYVKRPITIS